MIIRRGKNDPVALTERVAGAFLRAGIRMQTEPWLREKLGARADALFPQSDQPCEGIVAVGGDGTLLRANQRAIEWGVPLLGVNAGHIGFLVEGELDGLEELASRLAADEYRLERRMMLEAKHSGGKRAVALNDVVISRGGNARLIVINAYVDQDLIGRFTADGLIVATPTGSTGYSLSAGGPIVCPEVDCLLISPICAHSLQHRPVITAATQRIRIELETGQRAQLEVDGQRIGELRGGECIEISKAPEEAQLIRMEDRSFFRLIRHKLSEWSC